jgi:hypothetical protein
MKAHRDSGCIAPLILTLVLDEGEWSNSNLGGFIPGKELMYLLNRKRGGPQSLPGRFRKENNLLFLLGFQRGNVQAVA